MRPKKVQSRDKTFYFFPAPKTDLSKVCATAVEDAGFWPVIRRPSTTTKLCQLGAFSKCPPKRFSSSSTRNGTTLVRCTSSSSLFVKPVTRLPFTRGRSFYRITQLIMGSHNQYIHIFFLPFIFTHTSILFLWQEIFFI